MVNLIKKLIKYTVIMIVALLLLALLPIFLIYRKYLQYRIIKNRVQRLSNGINILEPVEIGGIKQWISVRGENKENPMLLILHGGPGFSMMPYSFIFDSLESDFIMVQWDQRGAGKTYTASKKILSSITVDKIQSDALELVSYLRHRFKKEKIFILGHSWGSVLGLKLAQDRPELISGYIGVGQLINAKINEKTGYDNTLKIAREKNHIKAIQSLENLNSFRGDNFVWKEVLALRKWQFKFNKISIKKSKFFSIIINALSSPEYSLIDYISLVRGLSALVKSKNMFNEMMSIKLDDRINISTPIFIFGGRKDPITPSIPVYEYFEKIVAPHKEYIWFEHSGHNLFFEEAEKFVKCLRAACKTI